MADIQGDDSTVHDLPEGVRRALLSFVSAAREGLGDTLISVVLFGSAAEGRLREASDVNVMLLLRTFDAQRTASLAAALRFARVAARLAPMFLLDSELEAALRAFAVKFHDMKARHRVLYGTDPFTAMQVPREATKARLKQVLLNCALRWREQYVAHSDQGDALLRVVARAAGPLRACASSLLELEDGRVLTPRDALRQLTARLDAGTTLPATFDSVRGGREVDVDTVRSSILSMIELATVMRGRVEALP